MKIHKTWEPAGVISKTIDVDERVVKNVIKLLKEEHTIPFIARYRKELSGDLTTAELYKIKEQTQHLDNLAKKIEKSVQNVNKLGALTPSLNETIIECTSAAMLDQVMAAYKPGKKRSRCEVAMAMGLTNPAQQLLDGRHVEFSRFVGAHENLKTLKNVVEATKDILVEAIRTDKNVLEWCDRVSAYHDNVLECSKSKSKVEDEASKEKFDQYFEFKRNIGHVKPFQMMAISRGEALKALTIKITLAEHIRTAVKRQCGKVVSRVRDPELQCAVVDEACARLVVPLIARRIRSRLKELAVDSSLDVFAENLKNLLLTAPYRGIRLMAVDPGFKHGCKVAVLDEQGKVLTTRVVYLNFSSASKVSRFTGGDEAKLQRVQEETPFTAIVIGNGTACRETESAISAMIREGRFREGTQYSVVDERGASVYSVTPLAELELPGMDPNLRSAVSIGRRVLDPLSEYLKIEPKHLGVGQYQHDIAPNKLNNRLDCVVTEAVSFTGLDLNRSSLHTLQKIAGLTKTRAEAILKTRESMGFFTNREQVRAVKGIGPKSYEQCIGFLRVYPNQLQTHKQTGEKNTDDDNVTWIPSNGKRKRPAAKTVATRKKGKLDVCHLDQTSIHPESYQSARVLIKAAGLNESEIGTEGFVKTIQSFNFGMTSVSCDDVTKAHIITSLSQLTSYDYRDTFSKPIFKSEITSLDNLKIGMELEGRVSNVTHFGAFVDVGLSRDGLIHSSKMRGVSVKLGDRVSVKVDKHDRKGVGLVLIRLS